MQKAELSDRIETRVCQPHSLAIADLKEDIDFAVAMSVVHEVPDVPGFFSEIYETIKPTGELLVAEPKGHVSEEAFDTTVSHAEHNGFEPVERPRVGRYRRSTRSLYLPGFGALFFLEVGFPLIAPATTETSPDRETTDALWAEVRENMRSQGRPGRHSTQRTRAHYDNLKVESLQRMLHRAVTHCANLRQLAPDDQIIALAINASSTRTGGLYFDAAGAHGSYYSPSSASGGAAPADVLAVKTTKKEVDALARGQVSPADFQERVQTLTYELPLLQAQSLPQPR